ncbi:ATP-binding protein [Enterovirga aerilata]|uniref:DUF853 family protein n=1 Tax=Enterovirga aerilata TaxID=2730920 RepID=A0A849IMC1_9HYPH|nr:type IV secretory system conjugative DNA transfer family protein [Enterovirga sp. DB1703]NNM75093.1 DUF853 family protein [Enterovirga sp. DB1703]
MSRPAKIEHPIPDEAIEKHIAILGKTGSGKTTTSKGIVERLLMRGERACIIDPTGVWWGLRLKADGKSSSGLDIVIFGGRHAYLPLAADQGARIAEIVGRSSTPVVLDTSQMQVGERTRFFTEFGNALVRENRGTLHVVVDEAHLFAPQGRVADPQSANMVHAANNLVSLGRSRGLRITLISQRPAKLHKDSLTQVETMIALRLVAPQDRKAVEEWIADQADKKTGAEIVASLPTLGTGEGWVWSPEIDLLKRIGFPPLRTFDSSRPGADDEIGAAGLPAIDVEALKAALATSPDPAPEVKATLGKPARVAEARQREYDHGFADGQRAGIVIGFEQARRALAEFQRTMAAALGDSARDASRDAPLSEAERARRYRERRRHASRDAAVTRDAKPRAAKTR